MALAPSRSTGRIYHLQRREVASLLALNSLCLIISVPSFISVLICKNDMSSMELMIEVGAASASVSGTSMCEQEIHVTSARIETGISNRFVSGRKKEA